MSLQAGSSMRAEPGLCWSLQCPSTVGHISFHESETKPNQKPNFPFTSWLYILLLLLRQLSPLHPICTHHFSFSSDVSFSREPSLILEAESDGSSGLPIPALITHHSLTAPGHHCRGVSPSRMGAPEGEDGAVSVTAESRMHSKGPSC